MQLKTMQRINIPYVTLLVVILLMSTPLCSERKKWKLIRGDDICFLRAVSCVVHGTQYRHLQICKSLVIFVEVNRHTREKVFMTGTFEEHSTCDAPRMSLGTQQELCAAASYHQLHFYVCSPHPATKEYHRLLFNLMDDTQLTFLADAPETPAISHPELCHTWGNHFDSVTSNNKLIPTSPRLQKDIVYAPRLIKNMYFFYKTWPHLGLYFCN